jgi:hypothetical protein
MPCRFLHGRGDERGSDSRLDEISHEGGSLHVLPAVDNQTAFFQDIASVTPEEFEDITNESLILFPLPDVPIEVLFPGRDMLCRFNESIPCPGRGKAVFVQKVFPVI